MYAVGDIKTDRSSQIIGIITKIIALAMVAFSAIMVFRPVMGVFQTQATHLGFALVLVYLSSMTGKSKKFWPVAIVLLVLSVLVTLYAGLNVEALLERAGHPQKMDTIIGVISVLVVIEACRRTFGWTLAIVTSVCWVYALFGSNLPDPFGFISLSWQRTVNMNTVSFHEGVYGTGIEASFRFIFLFIVMGAILQVSGAIGFFNEISNLVSSKFKSGVPMSAVISSALIGSVTGAAISNVAITGAYTIPMMKKAGLDPETAGAVEAAASSGGQFLPPIMGAAAFLMAAITGEPYILICGMAAIPAIMYFIAIGFYVYFMANKTHISSIPVPVNMKELLLRAPLFILPLGAIIYLLITGYSPMMCAAIAIVLLLTLSFFRSQTRPSLKRLVNGFTEGALGGAGLCTAIACINSAVGLLIYTTLTIKLAGLVQMWSGGHMFLALVLTAIISIILGVGLPTVAAYLIVAVVTVPILVQMGIPPLAGHLFCFFFAVVSYVTPPVALASMVASKISGGKFLRTAWIGFQTAIGGYIIPFMFIYCPVLLLQPRKGIISVIFAIFGTLLALFCIQSANSGYLFARLAIWERLILWAISASILVAAVLFHYEIFIASIVIFIAFVVYHRHKRKRTALATSAG